MATLNSGTKQLQLVVRVLPEDAVLSTANISLVLRVAPYDPVLVPLRQAIETVLKDNIRRIVAEYQDPDRFLKTLLNLGDDTQRILTNWKRDPNDSTKLLVKLLQPLDFTYDVGKDVFISREVANTVVDTVKFELLPQLDTTPYLRPHNTTLEVVNSNGNLLRNKTLSTIGINTEGIGDNYGNYTFSNEILRRWYTDNYKSAELNIDFGDYKNFVSYGSAELRLKAFAQKLSRLYDLEQNSRFFGGIATGSIFGTNAFYITTPVIISSSTIYPSPTTIVPPSGSLTINTGSIVTIFSATELPSASLYLQENSKKAALEMEQIIRSFDGYEQYLFYGSGSAYSASVYWTDNNTEYNPDGTWPKREDGTLYTPSELTAVNWYTTQSAIAQRYDEFNHNIIANAIPSYLQSDPDSVDFIKFVKLIGHFFDDIKLYIQDLPEIYNRDIIATQGLSQDIVWDVAKGFGIDVSNPHATDDLYDYIANGSLTKRRELTAELFKRFLHNSLYLNRAKGTRTALKALLNIFGLNEQIVSIRESDTPTTGSFEIFDENTNVLNFYTGSYLQLPLSSSHRDIHTIQFRFNTNKQQITTLATGDELWHLRLNVHPTASSPLGRIEVTNDIGEILLTSSYAPFFNDDYYDVMLRYNMSSVNLQVAKSDGEEILYTSSMYTTGSYLIDALPLTPYMYLGGSGSLSLNNFTGTVDEVRIWGEEIEDTVFLNQSLNPGSFAGNAYWSAAENLYVRLSFHKPTNLYLGYIANETPYKNKDGVSDPTKPLLPNITNILAYGFPSESAFPYQMSRIIRRVYQYTTNGGAAAYGSNKIIIQPPAVFTETTPLGEPILHRNKSIVSIDARKQQPQSKKFVGFFVSPTDAVNNLIIRSLGNVDVNDKVGYPGNRFKNSYPDLEQFKEYYNQFYDVPVNIPQFVRFFDKLAPALFEHASQLIPAKTILSTGIIIEPNILERKKVAAERPINLSGANTKRNLKQGTSFNPTYDITLSTEANTINLRSSIYVPSAIYEEYKGEISAEQINGQPTADVESNLDTTIEQSIVELLGTTETYTTTITETTSSIASQYLNYDATPIENVMVEPTGDYVLYTGDAINLTSNSIIQSSYITYEDAITFNEVLSQQNQNIVQAMLYNEIPPRADFKDYAVTNYFNRTSGIYYFERVQKQLIGSNRYNFLTGSQATWSLGTIYNQNDVVYQSGSTGEGKYGNGKLYRFVAPNAPIASYQYPSLDKNSWVPIFYTGKAIEQPYRVVFDTARTQNITDLRILPVTIVDIARPINQPGRYTSRLTLSSISANSQIVGSIRLQTLASLFSIRSSANVRIRLYDTPDSRNNDLLRPVGTEPIGNHGVLLDITITPDVQNINYGLYPAVTLVNNDTSPNALIYYTIDEAGGTTQNNVSIAFSYFGIDTESIVPQGYLQRHYKFFRDTLLATKRRNYLGCLQTQNTTTDGQPPVVVTTTAGTSITVSPNILTSEENLGGTNLNV